ncbi:unnamed protein product [Absidia cylindrospora]
MMTKRSRNDSLDGDHMEGNLFDTMKRPHYYRQNSVISRFESLRRQYSGNNYYDPYQQEQVQQQGKRKTMADDNDNSSQQQVPEGRPTKRRKSLTSMVKSGVIQSVLFGSALALTAFDYLQATTPSFKRSTSLCSMEALAASSHITTSSMDDTNNNWSAGRSSNHYNSSNNKQKKSMRGHGVDFSSYFYRSPTIEKRMQKTEQLIRDICLDQQYAFNQHFAPSTTSTRDDLCWGIVNKDDYDVNFTVSKTYLHKCTQKCNTDSMFRFLLY